MQKSQVVGRETIQNRPTLHLQGEVSGEKLNPLVGSTLKADVTYPVDLWIDEKSANTARIHVTEPEGNGWLIDLFGTMNRSTFRRRSCPRAEAASLNVARQAVPRADPRARLPPRVHRGARSHHRLRRAAGGDPIVDHRDSEARRRRMGRHRLLRLVCDQHDLHGEGVGYRRPPPRVSDLPRDLLRRVMAGRGLAGLARRHRAAE